MPVMPADTHQSDTRISYASQLSCWMAVAEHETNQRSIMSRSHWRNMKVVVRKPPYNWGPWVLIAPFAHIADALVGIVTLGFIDVGFTSHVYEAHIRRAANIRRNMRPTKETTT